MRGVPTLSASVSQGEPGPAALAVEDAGGLTVGVINMTVARRVCAWCRVGESPLATEAGVTHGICEVCLARQLRTLMPAGTRDEEELWNSQ